MPDPRAVVLEVDDEMRAALQKIERQYSTSQQLAQRVRIILLASAGKTHSQISQALGISIDMARLWRNRWSSFAPIPLTELSVSERLEDAPRAGKPSTISAEQVCQIVALACEAPEKSGRPISQWTGREIADELIRQKIVETISPRHAQRILKKKISNRTRSGIG
jgi:putative transposase